MTTGRPLRRAFAILLAADFPLLAGAAPSRCGDADARFRLGLDLPIGVTGRPWVERHV